MRISAEDSVKATSPPSLGRPRVGILCEDGQNCVAAGYALNLLLRTAGADVFTIERSSGSIEDLNGLDCVVSYGMRLPDRVHSAHLHICSSGFFTPELYLKRSSIPVDCAEVVDIVSMYPIVPAQNSGQLHVVDIDIVAATFVLLTGYEEIVTSGMLDRRGRRAASSLLQIRLSLMDRPVVNEYALFLRQQIICVAPGTQFRKRAWGDAPYALAITRDIDSLVKYGPHSLKQIASLTFRKGMRRSIPVLRQQVRSKFRHVRDPHDNLDEILEWEKQVGIRSSLYFMASDLVGDSNYKLDRLSKQWSFEDAAAQGWEIGFHPGYRTYMDPVSFTDERCEFEKAVGTHAAGGRQHGLRFAPPYTWRNWEDGGFLYDTSMGFPDFEGFRCGICTPFQPFDVLENRTMNLWEIPLTVMDCTLDSYRGYNATQSRQAMDRLLRQVKLHEGVFVLLWHNSYFGSANAGALHDELAGFVCESQADGALVAPVRELLNIWIQNLEA